MGKKIRIILIFLAFYILFGVGYAFFIWDKLIGSVTGMGKIVLSILWWPVTFLFIATGAGHREGVSANLILLFIIGLLILFGWLSYLIEKKYFHR